MALCWNSVIAMKGMSAKPEKLMYYKDGAWIEFCSSVVEREEDAFLQRNPAPEIDVDGTKIDVESWRLKARHDIRRYGGSDGAAINYAIAVTNTTIQPD
ncbi:hypothetical protein V2J09_009987 [Rumex salicifolius]